MRNYQLKGKYTLEKSLYKRTIATIQDYDRMVEELGDILTSTPSHDNNGGGRSNLPTQPTENLALRITELNNQLRIISNSLSVVPHKYREGVWYNITKDKAYPVFDSKRTYSRYKQIFIYEVAKRMGWVYSEE